MRRFNSLNTVCIDPFWEGQSAGNVDRIIRQDDIYAIVVGGVSLPDNNIPWDDIFVFRSDPSSQQQLRALRLWVSDMAKGKLTYAGAYDRINYLKEEGPCV
jgi:hypothetical protein